VSAQFKKKIWCAMQRNTITYMNAVDKTMDLINDNNNNNNNESPLTKRRRSIGFN